ncbi:phage holin family protein [Pseudomonas aeruginosa]
MRNPQNALRPGLRCLRGCLRTIRVRRRPVLRGRADARYAGGGTRRQALLEATLCTLITLGLIPVLDGSACHRTWLPLLGCSPVSFGVKKIAEFADRIADWKFPRRGAGE